MAYVEKILRGWAVKNGRTGQVVKVVDRADKADFHAMELNVKNEPAANHKGDVARFHWRHRRERQFEKLLAEASVAELEAFAARVATRRFGPDENPTLCPECRIFFDNKGALRDEEQRQSEQYGAPAEHREL